MKKVSIIFCLCILVFLCSIVYLDSLGWVDRAPLNTDSSLVGFQSALGLAKAYRYLAYLLNGVALAALLFACARQEADFTYYGYVYVGVTLGGMLFSFALSPLLHVYAILPITIYTAFLLIRFCGLGVARGATVAILFQYYQMAYIYMGL